MIRQEKAVAKGRIQFDWKVREDNAKKGGGGTHTNE